MLSVAPDAGRASAERPNDPGWIDQWAQRTVGLPAVWPSVRGDESVVVALVDTGVNELPDLQGALVPGWDFVDNDATPQDDYGHGTQTAGVIAARGDNGTGIAGTCWRCRIMPIRVARSRDVRPAEIAVGIRYAVDHGARIVNVSLSGDPSPEQEDAVRYAVAHGVLIVASAGNSGNDTLEYPAAYPGVLSVAATDETDVLYPWSSRGSWVDLAAPGCEVILDPDILTGTLCGSSFTPPLVSGIAALMLSARPDLTAQQIVALLRATAVPVAGINGGRVDARAAFEQLGVLQPPAPTPEPPQPSPTYAAQIVLQSGTMRRQRQFALRTAAGPLGVDLSSGRIAGCVLTVRSRGGAVIAMPHRGRIALETRVTAGRQTFLVRCGDNARRSYELSITALFRE